MSTDQIANGLLRLAVERPEAAELLTAAAGRLYELAGTVALVKGAIGAHAKRRQQ